MDHIIDKEATSVSNRLQWLGHSAWRLTTSQGKVILIDPWVGNPLSPITLDDVDQADLVLVTHDHGDHIGDSVAIVNKTGATFVAQPETSRRYQDAGIPEDRLVPGGGMNIGGSVQLAGITVTMTDAYHTSETGEPAGFILTLEDGKVVYHAGDTGLHQNMATWGMLYSIDIALLPIGSHFTMDGRQAAHALRLLKAKAAAPMHYRTFPLLAQSADEFVEHARSQAPQARIHVIEPGDEITF